MIAASLILFYPGILTGKAVGNDGALYGQWPVVTVAPANAVVGQNTFLYDATYVFHPDLQWARERIRSLTPPIWNPDHAGGYPVLAGQQTAPFFPLNAIAFIFPFWWSLGVILALKLVLGGLGTFLLARRLRLSFAPAAMAAFAFPFSSYFVSWLSHPHSSVWLLLPWAMLAADVAAERRRAPAVAALAAAWGLMLLAGHPESVASSGAFLLAFALWRCRGRGRGSVVSVVLGFALGSVSGAVMILPLAEALHQADGLTRGGDGGAPLSTLWSLVAPEWNGRPDLPINLPAWGNFLERTSYVGVIPLLLAVVGALRPRIAGGSFFLLAGLLCLALAYTIPAFTPTIADLPGVKAVALSRMRTPMALCIVMLAAIGLQRLIDRDRPAVAIGAVALGVSVVFPVILLVSSPTTRVAFGEIWNSLDLLGKRPTDPEGLRAATMVRWLCFTLAAAALLVAGARRAGLRRMAALAVVVLVALDVVNLQRGFFPVFDPTGFGRVPEDIKTARAAAGTGRVLPGYEALAPNSQNRYGVRSVLGHGLPEIHRNERLFRGLGGTPSQARRTYFSGDWIRLATAFGTSVVLAPQAVPDYPGKTSVTSAVYTFPGPPRAYVATRIRPATGEDDAFSQVTKGPLQAVVDQPVVEGADRPGVAGRATTTPAKVVRDGDVDVRVDVDAPRGGWLILLDNVYPGWKATVDGKRASIQPANVAFRAVQLPPGAHQVRFTYRPLSVIAGALLSVVGWLAIALLALMPALRRRHLRRSRRATG